MREAMLWNKDHTACSKASKIREIVIYPDRRSMSDSITSPKVHTEVKGWYNANEDFDFGWFDTKGEAQAFVDNLNAQIEGIQ